MPKGDRAATAAASPPRGDRHVRRCAADRANAFVAKVAKEVVPIQVWISAAPVDITAGDRAVARIAVVNVDRCRVAAKGLAAGGVIGAVALVTAPAIIFAAITAGRRKIDLFKTVLPNIPDPEVAGEPVETEAPGVAQAGGPDLITGPPLTVDKGIIRRDAVGCAAARVAIWAIATAAVDINAQQLAQQDIVVLAVILWIAGAAAITGSNVEITICAKL